MTFTTKSNRTAKESAMFLGQLLDAKLSWKLHIEHKSVKVNTAIFRIKHTRRIVNTEVALTAYTIL